MEKVYAQALWEMVASGMDAKKAAHAVAARLAHDGRANLLPSVGRAFERIAAREARRNDIVLSVARQSDLAAAEKKAKSFIESFGGTPATLKTQVDDTLIGGWRLEGREQLVDASQKQQLLNLYQRVTQGS